MQNFTIRAVQDEDCEKFVENIVEKIKLNQRINPITLIFAHPLNVKLAFKLMQKVEQESLVQQKFELQFPSVIENR